MIDVCREVEPELENAGGEHNVACHRWKELLDVVQAETSKPTRKRKPAKKAAKRKPARKSKS